MTNKDYESLQALMNELRRIVFDVFSPRAFDGESAQHFDSSRSAFWKFQYADFKVQATPNDPGLYYDLAVYAAYQSAKNMGDLLKKAAGIINREIGATAVKLCSNIVALASSMDAKVDESVQQMFETLFDSERSEVRFLNLQQRIVELEAHITQAISGVTPRLKAAINLASTEFEDRLAQKDAEVDEKKKELQKAYDEAINSVLQKKEELNQAVGATTSLHLIKDYASAAGVEKTSADNFRSAALALMGFALALFGLMVISSPKSAFEVENIATKLVISLLFLIPTAYVGREAAKHRTQFHKLRQTALDLSAVNPYLASLKEENQDKVKMEIASKIFVPSEGKVENDGMVLNTHELLMKLMDKMELPSRK